MWFWLKFVIRSQSTLFRSVFYIRFSFFYFLTSTLISVLEVCESCLIKDRTDFSLVFPWLQMKFSINLTIHPTGTYAVHFLFRTRRNHLWLTLWKHFCLFASLITDDGFQSFRPFSFSHTYVPAGFKIVSAWWKLINEQRNVTLFGSEDCFAVFVEGWEGHIWFLSAKQKVLSGDCLIKTGLHPLWEVNIHTLQHNLSIWIRPVSPSAANITHVDWHYRNNWKMMGLDLARAQTKSRQNPQGSAEVSYG